ncbi:MAG: SDR family NAD(P)-dependent oxidoreductase, partial [Myxococcota bacterium]|nr:SDR family NAD(P)-dependent oxidoreductase [Myxococcota bacterium]
GYRRHARRFEPTDLDVDLSGVHVLVTGGNGGLGMATARGLLRRGASVHLACRRADAGAAAAAQLQRESLPGTVRAFPLDLETRARVDAATPQLPPRVDVLIHNAGILPAARGHTEDGLERTLAVNLVGPHRLTWALRDALARSPSPRVILVSSGGMYLQRLDVDQLDNEQGRFDGPTAYARTKRAQVVLAPLLQDRLGPRAHVSSMHPGWADTGGVRRQLPTFYRVMKHRLRTPAEGADTTVWLAARRPAPDPAGGFFFDRAAQDPAAVPGTRTAPEEAERLWHWLCEQAGVPAEGWRLPD